MNPLSSDHWPQVRLIDMNKKDPRCVICGRVLVERKEPSGQVFLDHKPVDKKAADER